MDGGICLRKLVDMHLSWPRQLSYQKNCVQNYVQYKDVVQGTQVDMRKQSKGISQEVVRSNGDIRGQLNIAWQ